MAFVTTSVLAFGHLTERPAKGRVLGRLRHNLGVRRATRGQQRADRYVANMPTAVLGAC